MDAGETIVWDSPDGLDPGTLNLYKNASSAQAKAINTVASFASLDEASTLGGMSELGTGGYNFSILDKATSGTLGKANLISNSSSMTLDHSSVESTSSLANVMTSGQYTLEITDMNGPTDISYRLTKTGDTSFGNNGTLVGHQADLNGSAPVAQDASKIGIGLTGVTITGINHTATMGTNFAGQEFATGTYTIEISDIPNGQGDVYLRIYDSMGSYPDVPKQISDLDTGNGTATGAVFLCAVNGGTALYNTGCGLILDITVPPNSIAEEYYTYIQYTKATAGSGAGVGDLVDDSGNILCVNIGTDLNSLAIGQTMSFEYIAKNEAKVALENNEGQALQIAQNTGGTQSGLYSYVAAGASYNSERGVSTQLADIGTLATGASGVQNFTYERANAYSVDLSNATKAGEYVTTVNTALNKVTSSLADLGSLMARLSFKAEQTANAQVNVEGAYSRIMNANMAEEQMNASKFGILQQTAVAMLAQANMAPQNLLSLFR